MRLRLGQAADAVLSARLTFDQKLTIVPGLDLHEGVPLLSDYVADSLKSSIRCVVAVHRICLRVYVAQVRTRPFVRITLPRGNERLDSAIHKQGEGDAAMGVGKDHLVVKIDGDLIDATMSITTVPADPVGPAYRKYKYELSNGRSNAYGHTRREALEMLLSVAGEQGWTVYQPLSASK
jgi:hypothetical protein